MARSISSSAAGTLFIGSEATKTGNCSGNRLQISAMPSLAMRANSGDCSGPPSISGAGALSVSTCTTSGKVWASMAARASMSHSMRMLVTRLTKPASLERALTSSKYAGGRTWLKMSIFFMGFLAEASRSGVQGFPLGLA